MRTVLCLLCKQAHLQGSLHFATALNEALNGSGGNYEYDVSRRDVEALLAKIEMDKKGFMDLLKRRKGPHFITRTMRNAFERIGINFDGSVDEWENEGRREDVLRKRGEKGLPDYRRREQRDPKGMVGGALVGGVETRFRNTDGVEIERWAPVRQTPRMSDSWVSASASSAPAGKENVRPDGGGSFSEQLQPFHPFSQSSGGWGWSGGVPGQSGPQQQQTPQKSWLTGGK